MDRSESLKIIGDVGIATIDHITHIDNLESIFKHGLLSHNNPYKKVDISNQDVNTRRTRTEPYYGRKIHDYVPLYFNPRNAMLYRNQKMFGDEVVILAFEPDILLFENSLFTNGNAASNNTYFSNDIKDLLDKEWNWEKIGSRSWYCEDHDDIKKSMMAEVLVYKALEMSKLTAIFCSSNKIKKYLEGKCYIDSVCVSINHNYFF